MASRLSRPSSKAFIPIDLVHKIYALFDVTPVPSTSRRTPRPITATLTTSDGCRTTIDLNVCRPKIKSMSRLISDMPEMEILEDLVIVWLDQNINKMEEDISKGKNHLRQIINCVKPVDNVSDCLHYIKNIEDEKILFIVPGSLGRSVINEVNNSSQVLGVYIYCSNKRDHEVWVKEYSKIIGVFTSQSELMTQISQDVSSFFQTHISIDILNSVDVTKLSIEDLTQDQARFLWSQVLIEVLLQLPQTSQRKNDLIQECRRFYHDNHSQQRQITEFERTYTPSDALSWYTQDSFLYRIINKALRTQNIFYIFKYRFFILDLYQQLTRKHRDFLKTMKKNVMKVYRGQLMATNEFEKFKNNINGFISINTFLSTSHSSNIALNCAGNGSQRPLFESVYFEIELDLNNNQIHFADVNYGKENELLLCPGTVFHIETVEPLSATIWYVKLNSETAKSNLLKQSFIKELDRSSSYLALGQILQDTKEYEKARTYYELLLIELPSGHPDIPAIYSGLGASIMSMEKDLKLALKYLRESLMLQLKTLTENIILFMQTIKCIADIYIQRQKFNNALTLYHFILEILDSIQAGSIVPEMLKIRADVCDRIGYIHSKTDNLTSSLKYYKNSLSINRKLLSVNHPKIAETLNSIGMIHLKKFQSDTAEEYFREANRIRQHTLPREYHPDLAQMHINLGTTQFQQAHFDKALFHFDKALEIQMKCLPPIHPHIAILYNNIGNVYLEKKNYSIALQTYENSLRIGQQCWPIFHPEISQIYKNIGTAHRYLGNYDKALRNCQKALEIALKCLPATHSNLAESYRAVGKVYNGINNHTLALAFFQEAMDIYQKNPPNDKYCLGTLYEELGNEYYDEGYYQDALKCLIKALELYQICQVNQSSLQIFYFHLGKAYYQTDDYENALIYYNKSLQLELANTSKPNCLSLSQIYHAIGEAFQQSNDYQMSLKNYSKAVEIILNDNSPSISIEKSRLLAQYHKSIETVKNWL